MYVRAYSREKHLQQTRISFPTFTSYLANCELVNHMGYDTSLHPEITYETFIEERSSYGI